MVSLRLCICILLVATIFLADAFQQPNSFRLQQASHPALSSIEGASHRQLLACYNTRGDKKAGDTPKYNRVEDGSPIGVAIVIVGFSLLAFGDDLLSDVPWWVVPVTASTAAGITRLIKYLREN